MFPTATLIPYGPQFNVSTLTPLCAVFKIEPYPTVEVSLVNPDPTNEITLIVYPGSNGGFDPNNQQSTIVKPMTTGVLTLRDSMWEQISIAAQTDDPFPAVTGVTFQLRGRRRGRDPY